MNHITKLTVWAHDPWLTKEWELTGWNQTDKTSIKHKEQVNFLEK